MNKRSLQHLGIALIVLPIIGAAVLQVWKGNVVSSGPAMVVSERDWGATIAIVSEAHLTLHWAILLPLLLLMAAGAACIWIANRRGLDDA